VKVQLDIHKDLIELCKVGNEKAQFRLYNLYTKAMYNICFRMMNNPEEAEDMLLEAFAETFQKLNTFRYESTFGAWIKRIVVNKCIKSGSN
jgi:RNA polymerase sigma-70 factor (ECF subfamily)